MNTFLREIVFPCGPESTAASWLLLALRVLFGGLLLVHGIQKVMDFQTLSTTFPDPIGLGSRLSLILAIFAELVCSVCVIFGLLFRLSLLPVIFTMGVATFVALKGAPWLQRELPFSYMAVFILLLIAGPGRFSLDSLICKWLV